MSIPLEFFSPFVTAAVDALAKVTKDEACGAESLEPQTCPAGSGRDWLLAFTPCILS